MESKSKHVAENEEALLISYGFSLVKSDPHIYNVYEKKISRTKKTLCFVINHSLIMDAYFSRWIIYHDWARSKSSEDRSLFNLEDFLIFFHKGGNRLFSHTFLGWYMHSHITHLLFSKHANEITPAEYSVREDLFANGMLCLKDNKIVPSRINGGVIVINNYLIKKRGNSLSDIMCHEMCHMKYKYDAKFRDVVETSFDRLSYGYKNAVIDKLRHEGYVGCFADEWSASIIEKHEEEINTLWRKADAEDKSRIMNIRNLFYEEIT